MATSVLLLKRQLRKEIQQSLKSLSQSQILEESTRCSKALFKLPSFLNSQNVSVYLSMPTGELQTNAIVEKSFQLGKQVYVPFIDGPIMHMVQTPNFADIQQFPANSWGIPEPASRQGRSDSLEGDGLDLIIVPGVGFDRVMNRIGHGKGYYDHFIQRCHEHAKKSGREPPLLVALALRNQLVEEGKIPMSETDWKMDVIIVDGEVWERNH